MIHNNAIGQSIDGYHIEGLINQGAVGLVYRALTTNDEPVAIKVCIPPSRGACEVLMTRFQREAQTLARLSHPHIVSVLDIGMLDDHLYMVMPLISGDSVAGLLQHQQCFDEITVTDIGWQVAEALFHVAEQGIVHRDVKPSNVLITSDGQALLTDFGVAFAVDKPSITKTGHILGTPAYLAPEQAGQCKPIDGRADIYSLGVMLYQMVTGRLPFQGTSIQMLHAHVYDTPPRPSTLVNISPELEHIIMTALEKDPAKRFQDGRTMSRALLTLNMQLRQEQQPARNWRQTLNHWLAKLRLTDIRALSF
ncbi:MAG: serine/threonine protein kinase [Anaerolineae bacterium]|nr:serine/threonine protein kinase [Anaerolineae bacterium]